MKLGENIKKYRVERGMTQEQLAARLSLCAQAVSKWERGESLPDTALLTEICEALGVSLDRLFGREEVSKADLGYALDRYLGSFEAADRTKAAFEVTCCCIGSAHSNSPMSLCGFDLSDPMIESYPSVAVLNDHGFSCACLDGHLPFAAIFPESKDGRKELFTAVEGYGELFADLADGDVRRLLCRIHEKPGRFTFDTEYARAHFGLAEPEKTLEKAQRMGVLSSFEFSDNGSSRRAWVSAPSRLLTAVFTLLYEFSRRDRSFFHNSNSRNKPLITEGGDV